MSKQWMMVGIVVGGIALGAAALTWVTPDAGVEINREAPNFKVMDLATRDSVTLEDYRGSVTLVNIWATWCLPCREEMPLLEQLQQEYGADGLRVVGVSIDRGDADAKVKEFIDNVGVTFTILRDPRNTFARTFRTSGVPETLLIGRDGELVFRWKGPLDGDPEDRAAIEAALAGTTAPPPPATARVGVPVAFAAGLLSFLSPCVLPLIPTYAAVVTGMSFADLGSSSPQARARARRATMTNGVVFVAGFSLVFIALGASATLLGGFLADNRVWISRVGGVVLAVLGLHLLGVLRLPFADRTVRVDVANRPTGAAGTFLVGIAFGAGWTPCIGPALAGILTLSAASASVGQGVGLLAVYSLGLAVPFLLATAALDRFVAGSRRIGPWLPRLQQASGALVLVLAALLLTDSLSRLAELAARFQS